MEELKDEINILNEKIDEIDDKLNEILKLLRPVSAHAEFVDDLKNMFNSSSVLKTLGITRINNTKLLDDK